MRCGSGDAVVVRRRRHVVLLHGRRLRERIVRGATGANRRGLRGDRERQRVANFR